MSLKGNETAMEVLHGRIHRADKVVLNAYDIAVKKGFKGTEEEWLESLNGGIISIDKLLYRSGMAADAKAVGERLKPLDDHASNTANPHGVTAEQVGARPNTWTPTASEVGAAPSGFGYGESLVGYSVETEAELETQLLEILNTMSNYTTKQVRINLGFLGVNTYYLTTIYKHTAVYALVTFQTMRFIGASLLKVYANSTWNAICWENPPMNLGVEHRTTERWNGKAVYTKVFDFGALPNASSKTVAINIPTTFIVRADHVIHSSDGKVIQSPYFLADGTLVVKHLITGSGIQITTTADYSGYTATFQIWYTKEDWK